MKNVFPIGLLVLACAPLLSAADYQGADAVLKKLAEQQAKAPGAAKPSDPVAELRKRMAAYRAEAATLTPEQAAEQWLALFDIFTTLPPEAMQNPANWQDRLMVQSFFQLLPPSADWDALAKSIEARAGGGHDLRNAALRVLAATLRGDAAARKQAFEAVRKVVETGKMDAFARQNVRQQLDMMEDTLVASLGDEGERLAVFEKNLAQSEKRDPNGRFAGMTQLEVPDLVKLAGREKATTLLRRALGTGLELEIEAAATRRLAVTLTLQSVGKLKKPIWGLIREVDDAPLYEAFIKKFPNRSAEDAYQGSRADNIYFVSLIVHNRAKDAVAFATAKRNQTPGGGSILDREMTDYLVRKGLVRQVCDFFRELLSTDPAAPYWSDFIELSARLGESDRALAFLREIIARPNLPEEARPETDHYYANALLAADQVDEGVKVLRGIIQAGPRAKKLKADDVEAETRKAYEKLGIHMSAEALERMGRSVEGRTGSGLQTYTTHCLVLARVGNLLGKPELVTEGVTAAIAAFNKAAPRDFERRTSLEELLRFLVTTGRGPEAEQFLIDEMTHPDPNNPSGLGEMTEELAAVYHLAGRHEDVLKLLDGSPYWGAGELAYLADREHFGVPILLAAAKALAVAGRKEEARRVVDRLLEHRGGYDPAYALLLELGGDGLDARLDALAQRDRFEERPLIWKAKLQLDAGRTDDAEKTVRAAIAIDPSDGEEGKGDRMRAYSVLGDVLEKKGDLEQAKIMHGAVEAIRLSENADDWWEAGLLTRAVKMYEEALGHFADAYCIQSRLALRYSELGDYAKAEQHYQRAFELMPESFGRIESHCFGCEGAFAGERAQNIAERVFTQLAAKAGARAQVFYLLGYLRQEQARWGDAAAQYRQAVKLDPDYFNAWDKLYEMPNGEVPQPDIEAAVLAMLRLDPAMRHHSGDFGKVHNLRGLWDAVLGAEKARPPLADGPIYPLGAAREAIDRRAKAMRDAGGGRGMGMPMPEESIMTWRSRAENIREQFAQHPLLSTVANLLEMSAMPQ